MVVNTGAPCPLMSGVSTGRRRYYRSLAMFTVAWTAVLLLIALTVVPDLYFFSYYSVDYSVGFIRRGLAGELLGVFPDEHYFSGLRVMRWIPSIIYLLALAAVAWTLCTRFGRSERRFLLALLVAVLPFGTAFALFSARPDLIGSAALATFATVLAAASSEQTVVRASAAYGLVSVPLTLMHEAIPFLYALGVLASIAVLAAGCTAGVQRLSAALAVGPGIATAIVVALLGRRGSAEELCRLIPSGQVDHPLAGKPSPGQILSGFHYYVDYQAWMCRAILPYYDQGAGDAARFVASRGPLLLGSSVLLGVVILVVTMLAISHVAGVPIRSFADSLRPRQWWLVAGAALMLPVFVTGVDWTRWFVIISFDLGVVYLLYAAARPESATPPTQRALVVFGVGMVLLALFPLGVVPGFAGVFPE